LYIFVKIRVVEKQ